MGVVYISREAAEDRFTVGAAKSLIQRKRGGYTRYNPRLKTYRILKTADHFAIENFLHGELADKRILEITSESWYAVTSKEIDEAITRAETYGNDHVARKKQVGQIKNLQSNGEWLAPDERIREIYDRLSQLQLQKAKLRHEENALKLEAMAFIGVADGVDGLFQWSSHPKRQFQTKIFASKYRELYDSFCTIMNVRKFTLWGGNEEDFEETDNNPTECT